MFLSAKSFADLKGKALLCESIKSGQLSGYFFLKNFKYKVIMPIFENDKFKAETSPFNSYRLIPGAINLQGGLFIDRKTLKVEGSSGLVFSQCELYDSKKLKARIEKQNKELQEKYDKKRAKENKI